MTSSGATARPLIRAGDPPRVPERLLDRLRPAAHDIADAGEQVLDDVHAEGALGRDDLEALPGPEAVRVGFRGKHDRSDGRFPLPLILHLGCFDPLTRSAWRFLQSDPPDL